ncbi:hypothetical protein SKAU_G00317100 [Synaphobranchus kaupii]|uniref:Uncharacterized protein n=1 Tax=Synaphobranchus kaupii TaxID=118154 RepID=A0A9Q1IKW5_SYNKA|nr:hypothetical protein SKAU_G00317100 [Synaphobranchus kaupii]
MSSVWRPFDSSREASGERQQAYGAETLSCSNAAESVSPRPPARSQRDEDSALLTDKSSAEHTTIHVDKNRGRKTAAPATARILSDTVSASEGQPRRGSQRGSPRQSPSLTNARAERPKRTKRSRHRGQTISGRAIRRTGRDPLAPDRTTQRRAVCVGGWTPH